MQVISSGGIPLALALGVRGYRLRRPAWIVVAWVVATWQLLLGFTLGLPFAYLLMALWIIAGIVWWRRGRPQLDRGLAVATIAGAVLFVGAGFALSRPYEHVADAHPNARRSPSDVEAFAAPPWAYVVAPDENLVWGAATGPVRDTLSNVPEETLFPGLAILVLAIAGLGSTSFPRWLRLGLGIAVVVVAVLAMGFRSTGWFLWPYRWIYELLPGWQAIRAPGRLDTFTALGLALLAGAGLQRLIAWRRLRSAAAWRGGAAIASVVVLAILVEGRGLPFDPFDNQAQPKVPAVPPSTASVPAPQLHLPAERATDNRRYVLWSTDGYPKIVNGRSSLNPQFTESIIRRERGFPDRRGVKLLLRLGVRSVVLHANRAEGTPWQDAAGKPLAGLPLTRSRLGDLVVYEVQPGVGPRVARGRRSSPALAVTQQRERQGRDDRRPGDERERRRPMVKRRDGIPGDCRAEREHHHPSEERTHREPDVSQPRAWGGPRGEHHGGGQRRDDRGGGEPAVADADHGQQRVLDDSGAELVGPVARAVVPDQREGHRRDEHQNRRGDRQRQRQRREPPVGDGEAEGQERQRRDQEARSRGPPPKGSQYPLL